VRVGLNTKQAADLEHFVEIFELLAPTPFAASAGRLLEGGFSASRHRVVPVFVKHKQTVLFTL
jgi:hypothetical protein